MPGQGAREHVGDLIASADHGGAATEPWQQPKAATAARAMDWRTHGISRNLRSYGSNPRLYPSLEQSLARSFARLGRSIGRVFFCVCLSCRSVCLCREALYDRVEAVEAEGGLVTQPARQTTHNGKQKNNEGNKKKYYD